MAGEQPVGEVRGLDLCELPPASAALQEIRGREADGARDLNGHPELIGFVGVGDREGAGAERAVGLEQPLDGLRAERGGQREHHAIGLQPLEHRGERANRGVVGG